MTVSSETSAEPPFFSFQQRFDPTHRHCSQSGHGSRARRREVRKQTPHRFAEEDVMQPVTNYNNDAGITSNSLQQTNQYKLNKS